MRPFLLLLLATKNGKNHEQSDSLAPNSKRVVFFVGLAECVVLLERKDEAKDLSKISNLLDLKLRGFVRYFCRPVPLAGLLIEVSTRFSASDVVVVVVLVLVIEIVDTNFKVFIQTLACNFCRRQS